MKRLTFALLFLFLGSACAQNSMKLTLAQAVQMALKQNHTLKIARLKVVENEQKKAAAKTGYYPEITNRSGVSRTTTEEHIDIPAGAFGSVPIAGLVPHDEVRINQGLQTLITSGTMVAQPLTPLIRIGQANRIAASEVVASRDDLKKAENEVALKVHEVYYGILIAGLQKSAAQQDRIFSRTRLSESEEDIRNGNALRVAAIEGQADLLQSEQNMLTIDLRMDDLNTELNELLGLPLSTRLELSALEPASLPDLSREDALRMALDENPQLHAAQEGVKQAQAALRAAKSAYIPDVSVFARHSYQNGVAFLDHNFGTFGVSLTYDVFDFGKRRDVVREREAQLAQAQENVERLKESVSVQIDSGYNKVERTRQMLKVSTQVVKLRAEGERVAENQVALGVVLVSTRRQASAASYKAQADLLQAQLANLLARAELEQTIGRTPGQ